MSVGPHDEAIARLETELRESRTQAWDVETFLANRHQTKIEALTAPDRPKLSRYWEVVNGLSAALAFVVGYLTIVTIAGLWLLEGHFPIHRSLIEHDREYHRSVENLVPPPLPPCGYRVGQTPRAGPAPAPQGAPP